MRSSCSLSRKVLANYDLFASDSTPQQPIVSRRARLFMTIRTTILMHHICKNIIRAGSPPNRQPQRHHGAPCTARRTLSKKKRVSEAVLFAFFVGSTLAAHAAANYCRHSHFHHWHHLDWYCITIYIQLFVDFNTKCHITEEAMVVVALAAPEEDTVGKLWGRDAWRGGK